MTDLPRVVITGVGLTSPNGDDLATYRRNLLSGVSGVQPWEIRHVGRHLSDFLRSHPLSRERPWLSDLANLEWTRLAAFDAADAEPLALSELESALPDSWPQLRLRAVPSFSLLAFNHPVSRDLRGATTVSASVVGTRPELVTFIARARRADGCTV